MVFFVSRGGSGEDLPPGGNTTAPRTTRVLTVDVRPQRCRSSSKERKKVVSSRATGKVYYLVEERGSEDFGVLRVNQTGQGWGVSSYKTRERAEEVAAFLTSMVEHEQWAEPRS